MQKLLICIFILFYCIQEASAQIRKRRKNNDININYANPQKYEIADIEVVGLDILDENAIISLTGLKIGDEVKVPGDKISNAIRKLWKHGLVEDIDIQASKIEAGLVYLTIKLTERPRLISFSFEGIKKGKTSELSEDLNLIRGKIITDALKRNAQLLIKEHFLKKGYLNTEVKIVESPDKNNNNGIHLDIIVDKHKKIKVKDIRFVGNNNFKSSLLDKKMKKTNEKVRFSIFKNLFSGKSKNNISETKPDAGLLKRIKIFISNNVKLNFLKNAKFIQSEYEADKTALIDFYNSQGYIDAAIVSDSIIANNDNSIDVVLTIDEGNQYFINDITWSGNFVYDDAVLDRVLNIQKGDIYNKQLITQKLSFNPRGADISGLYMDEGYLFFSIDPVEVGIEGDSVNIEMRIYEGEQATIDEVIIKGNDKTSDHVIRRELYTVPGELFSRSDIIRTQQQLSQLGFFNPETVNPVPIPDPADGTVDIEWNLEERSSDQIELSGGWGGNYGFIGTLGLVLNNFSINKMFEGDFNPIPAGDGQRLSLRAQANGQQYQNYSFSFTEPWLGGRKPNSFTVSYNRSISRTITAESTSSTDYQGSLKLHNFSIGLGQRLKWPDNYFTITNSIGYTLYELDDYNYGLGFSDGSSSSVTFNTTLARRSINNPMFPSSGSEVSLSLTLTPPHSLWRNIDYSTATNEAKYSWIEYHKWMFDAKYYFPITEKLVVEARAHFGFLGSYGNREALGPFERFYLGGDGLAGQNFLLGTEVISLRGYENNVLTPPYTYYNSDEYIKGGVVYDKFSLELRHSITTGQAATIYGFVFVEGGNNWDSFRKFDPLNLYRSAGFGARIFMPAFGLIGVNWGYGFDTVPGYQERSGPQFHFTIGQQIR